jgi:putative ABC transport system ATP-binding protein
METFIEIAGLQKDFIMGDVVVRALAGIDLSIERSSFSVVMGPSGSGKSTLLHLLGGLDQPTAGSLNVGGQSIDKLDENALAVYRRRTVGFIFQSFNLIQSMNALENVAFPMRFAHTSPHQRKTRAQELLQKVGLSDRAVHRPTELSGGQQQRVAIARALVNDPQLILADEPTGNLDTASGMSIMQLLSELHRSGHTIFVVTHDPRMKYFATQMVFLLDGRIVSQDEYQAAADLSGAGQPFPPAHPSSIPSE